MRIPLAFALALMISGTDSRQTNTVITTAGDGSSEDIPAWAAGFGVVEKVAADALGNAGFALEKYHVVMRLDSTGRLTRIAGTGTPGYSGEDGAATSAQLKSPLGIAVDSAGNLYIADSGNFRIRRISNGMMTTVAGDGTQGYGGDNGPAASAQFSYPAGVAADLTGDLYVADVLNDRVRKISNGVITTVAGDGTNGYSGDNGLATSAQLSFPCSVAVDSAGDLYIADAGNNRIRKVSNGVITTIAGDGIQGYSGDDGIATSAQLDSPRAVAVDSDGNLYFADYGNHRIRKVSKGIITTVAGDGTYGYGGDGGLATSAQLGVSWAIAVDFAGNLYLADTTNYRIRKVSNGMISTVVGNGSEGYSGDNTPAATARWGETYGITVDAWGTVYLTAISSHQHN